MIEFFLLVCHVSLRATKNVGTNWVFILVDVASLRISACLQQTKSSKFMQVSFESHYARAAGFVEIWQWVASGVLQLYTFVPVQ